MNENSSLSSREESVDANVVPVADSQENDSINLLAPSINSESVNQTNETSTEPTKGNVKDDILYSSDDTDQKIIKHLDSLEKKRKLVATTTTETDSSDTDDEYLSLNDYKPNYNPNEPQGSIDLEMVGLFGVTNGRSCSCHDICGEYVEVGDLVRLVKTTVEINAIYEDAIKVVKIEDGVDSCTVGYIPRVHFFQMILFFLFLKSF